MSLHQKLQVRFLKKEHKNAQNNLLLTWTKISTAPIASFPCALVIWKANENKFVIEAISDQVTKPNRFFFFFCFLLLLFLSLGLIVCIAV